MSKNTGNNVKCAAIALTAGGLTFAVAKMMSNTKTQVVKKATGKAIKAIGSVIESLQM